MRRIYLSLIIVLLLLPFAILFLKVVLGGHSAPFEFSSLFFRELAQGFWLSLSQAFLSAIGATLIGFMGVLGFIGLKNKHIKNIFEIFILLPNFLPHLFIVLSAINIFDYMGGFPFGFWGVVLVHTLIYSGLVTVSLSKTITNKLGHTLDLGLIEGASRLSLIYVGIVKRFKSDFYYNFLFVFALCFTSFTIPFLIGQGMQVLEIQIYEKVRIDQNWWQAMAIALFESLVVFVLAIQLKNSDYQQKVSGASQKFIAFKSFNAVPLIISMTLIAGSLLSFYEGILKVFSDNGFVKMLVFPVFGSLVLGVGVGSLVFVLFLLMAWCWPLIKAHRFLLGYVAPSSVITSFAFLIWGPNGSYYSFVKIIVGITIITLPGLYKYYGHSFFSKLNQQILVARTLSASRSYIYKKIIFPQVVASIGFVSGLAAFWACGDFAVSAVLAYNDITLALVIKNLIQSYRLDMATFLIWGLLACGAFCYFIFGGLGRVLSGKSYF